MSRKREKLEHAAIMQQIKRQLERGNYLAVNVGKVEKDEVAGIRRKDGRYEIDIEVEIDGHTSVWTVRDGD